MKNIIRGVGRLPILLFLMTTSQPAISSLLENGGFETGDFTGWFAIGNLIVHEKLPISNHCCNPSEGQFNIDFNGGDTAPSGQLSQAFATISGTKYFFNFDFGKGGLGGGTSSLDIEVTGVNTLLNEVVADSSGTNPGQYSRYSFSFVADSTESTLIFSDISTGTVAFDTLLDNVSVKVIPLPTALWLFSSGLLALMGVFTP